MSKLVANYNGGTSDEYGTFLALGRIISGDVIEGFAVAATGTPSMGVLVAAGSARILTGTYPSSYGYMVSHDTSAGESVTIATAAASPRIDYVVAYVDKSVVGSPLSGNVNNKNNVLKFAAVAGTPAGSPVVPTVSQIQTAIGASNPYIILAQIAVAASVSQITNANITDRRTMATIAVQLGTSSVGTAQLAPSSVTSLKLAPSKTTDANGWTVYDYGTWKKYVKRFVSTPGSITAGNRVTIVGSQALPVGVSSLANVRMSYSAFFEQEAGSISVDMQNLSSSTTITALARNNHASAALAPGVINVDFTLVDA